MTKPIGRREFLYWTLLSGLAIGCRPRPSAGDSVPLTATPLIVTSTPPVTLAVDRRFHLQDEAISYLPHPDGCQQTTIRGTVSDEGGRGLAGMTIFIWTGDDPAALNLVTDRQGRFSVDVAQDVSDQVYKIQLVDDQGRIQLSDVVVAQAIPDCSLNLIELHFVPIP